MNVFRRRSAAALIAFLSSKLLLVLIVAALATLSLVLWRTEEARNRAQIAAGAEAKARSYASELETRFDRIYGALSRLAARGAPRTATGLTEWKKDAAFYIDTFPGIKHVAWVDENYRMREIVPLAANAAYLDRPASDLALEPLEVGLWLPTYDELDFQGFIYAIVGLEELLAPVVSEIADDYMLQLSDGKNTLYTSANWRRPAKEEIAAWSSTLKNTAVLNLALAPTAALLNAGTRGARNTLWYAILLSFITVIAVAFAQDYLGKFRSSELRYQNLFQSSKDAIFVTDLYGRFQDANRAGADLVGYTLAELQELTLPSLLAQAAPSPPAEQPQHWQDSASTETTFHHKQGNLIPVELATSPVGAAKQPKFIVVIARDITERKLAEAELHQYHDRLETLVAERTRALQEANAELESFSFSVSHDLRAPLRHIDGFIQLLDKRLGDQMDATAQRYLNNVMAASQRMGQLIDDLLRFSRTSRTAIALSPVEPAAIIQQVIEELQPTIADRTITWQIGALPTVRADASLLRVVWTNLIANAVKFTGKQEKAIITIGIDPAPRTDGRALFFIRDNGVGFDPAYAHNLFGVFQRLHRDDEFEGTGIGLATVRRIIHRHDGEIWAEGRVGEGASFFFTLEVFT